MGPLNQQDGRAAVNAMARFLVVLKPREPLPAAALIEGLSSLMQQLEAEVDLDHVASGKKPPKGVLNWVAQPKPGQEPPTAEVGLQRERKMLFVLCGLGDKERWKIAQTVVPSYSGLLPPSPIPQSQPPRWYFSLPLPSSFSVHMHPRRPGCTTTCSRARTPTCTATLGWRT